MDLLCTYMFLHRTYILKFQDVITAIINICNYTVDPPLTP